MSSTPLREIMPGNWIAPLKRLGRREWTRIVPFENGVSAEIVQPCNELLACPELWNYSRIGPGSINLLHLSALSRLIANGPKVFRPKADVCEALRHVETRLTLSEYQQPFENLLIEFPKAFRRSLRREFGVSCCKHILMTHRPEFPLLSVHTTYASHIDEHVLLVNPCNSDEEIERFIDVTGKPSDAQLAAVLHRIGINIALLLTRHSYVERPLDPERQRKSKRLLKSKSRTRRNRAKQYLNASAKLIEFEQDVTLYDRETRVPANTETTGTRRTPFWRRGHWKRQRFGPGNSLTKWIFVRPTMINARWFDGDPADTSYGMNIPTQRRLVAANTNVGTAI